MPLLYPSYLTPLEYYALPEQQRVIQATSVAKAAGKKIVIASGVFDLFHEAHKLYLERAKAAGDFLVVLIESDERTRELKGSDRPIWDQQKRAAAIAALSFVDAVMILPPEFKNPLRYEEITILLAPDVYAESSNSIALEHKKKMMEKYGARLEVVLDEIPDVSTTKILGQQG